MRKRAWTRLALRKAGEASAWQSAFVHSPIAARSSFVTDDELIEDKIDVGVFSERQNMTLICLKNKFLQRCLKEDGD